MGMDAGTDDAETLININKLLDYLLVRVDDWKKKPEKLVSLFEYAKLRVHNSLTNRFQDLYLN